MMADWTFLTNHARVLPCLARDPGVRLHDIAASLGTTERSAHGTVADPAEAGYVIKQKDSRRNRYQLQAHLPPPDPAANSTPPATSWPFLPAPAPGATAGAAGPTDALARLVAGLAASSS